MGQNVGVATLLARAFLLMAIVVCALLNGFSLSPVFDWADYMLGAMLGAYMRRGIINAYVAPAAVTAMTMAVAGIPAAVYERIRGLKSSTVVSLALWLAFTVLLTLPAILAAVADDELR